MPDAMHNCRLATRCTADCCHRFRTRHSTCTVIRMRLLCFASLTSLQHGGQSMSMRVGTARHHRQPWGVGCVGGCLSWPAPPGHPACAPSLCCKFCCGLTQSSSSRRRASDVQGGGKHYVPSNGRPAGFKLACSKSLRVPAGLMGGLDGQPRHGPAPACCTPVQPDKGSP